jgi:hypothetical protein
MVQVHCEFIGYGDCPFEIEPVLPAFAIVLPSVQHFEVGGEHTGMKLQNCVVHTDSLAAAVEYEYLPAPQSVQFVLPGVAEYLPVAHVIHVVAAVDTEYVPEAQFIHDPAERYLPGPQHKQSSVCKIRNTI